MAIAVLQHRVFWVTENDKVFKREQHIYEIEIKMVGVSGFVLFGGAGYFRGDMTIKCNKWGRGNTGQTEKYNIDLWELAAGLAAGVEVSLGEIFQSQGADRLPVDAPGF